MAAGRRPRTRRVGAWMSSGVCAMDDTPAQYDPRAAGSDRKSRERSERPTARRLLCRQCGPHPGGDCPRGDVECLAVGDGLGKGSGELILRVLTARVTTGSQRHNRSSSWYRRFRPVFHVLLSEEPCGLAFLSPRLRLSVAAWSVATEP